MIWHFSKNGYYQVKSGYRIAQELLTSTSMGMGEWLALWNFSIPNKVKHFLWRLLCKCLPIHSRLHEKELNIVNDSCVLYNQMSETHAHLFLKCESISYIWQQLGVNTGMITEEGLNGWFFELLSDGHYDEACNLCMMLWSIWNLRDAKL